MQMIYMWGSTNEGPRPRPELRNDSKAANKVAATVSALNAHAAEWKATADVLDGKNTR